jgi:threonine synthase
MTEHGRSRVRPAAPDGTLPPFLPVGATPPLTLGEGFPAGRAERLGGTRPARPAPQVEGQNRPAQDRGMVLAVAKAVEAGAGAIVCA